MYLKTGFRTASLLSRRHIVATSRATLSSSTIEIDDSSSDFITGRVKFYRRDKRYGIIVADDASIGEVFVHRESILSDDDLNHTRPYLKQSERVKFTTIRRENENLLFAQNLTLVDGTRVPKYRPGHVEAVIGYERRKLGNKVHDILSSDDISSENPVFILKEIQDAHDAGEKQIKEAEEAVNAQHISNASSATTEEGNGDEMK